MTLWHIYLKVCFVLKNKPNLTCANLVLKINAYLSSIGNSGPSGCSDSGLEWKNVIQANPQLRSILVLTFFSVNVSVWRSTNTYWIILQWPMRHWRHFYYYYYYYLAAADDWSQFWQFRKWEIWDLRDRFGSKAPTTRHPPKHFLLNYFSFFVIFHQTSNFYRIKVCFSMLCQTTTSHSQMSFNYF